MAQARRHKSEAPAISSPLSSRLRYLWIPIARSREDGGGGSSRCATQSSRRLVRRGLRSTSRGSSDELCGAKHASRTAHRSPSRLVISRSSRRCNRCRGGAQDLVTVLIVVVGGKSMRVVCAAADSARARYPTEDVRLSQP